MQKTLHVLITLALVACTPPPPAENEGTMPSSPPANTSDWASILRLEAEAKALVRTDGCSTSGGCRTAPVGSRACGGPRYYITYCATTTDSAALFRKLDQVAAAERAYNAKTGVISTCEFREPPDVESVGGSCREVTR